MPIFFKDNKRILFVHVPKCGGSYVENLFVKNTFKIEYIDRGRKPGHLNRVRRMSPQHMHASVLEAVFDLQKLDFIFTVVRDPLKRLVSEYKMQMGPKAEPEPINDWVPRILEACKTNPYIHDNHIRPQSEFLVEGCKIYRLENGLDEAWAKTICADAHISFKVFKIRDALVGRMEGLDTELSASNIDLIKDFYADDYRRLGYE